MPATLAPHVASHLNISVFRSGKSDGLFNIKRNADGTGLVTGIKIFKVGTFRDSMGIQHTWEPVHLEQMVFHFNHLKDSGILPNVPFRVDHSFSAQAVVGYFEKLYVEDGFLLADVLFTEPDALDKMERGTYRSRSAEVGLYETNDEAFYWPVVMGTAFVDIGAVEGLFSKTTTEYTILQEDDMADTDTTKPADVGASKPADAPAASDAPATPPTPPAEPSTPPAPAEPPTPPAADPAPEDDKVLVLNGKQRTSDFAAVQAHIAALETFRDDTITEGRKNFVKGLVAGNKLLATQEESTIEFALGLSADQFGQWQATWTNAPASSLLANHGKDAAGGAPPEDAPVATEIEILEETLVLHKRAGMTPEQIAKTDSFKKLEALKAASAEK